MTLQKPVWQLYQLRAILSAFSISLRRFQSQISQRYCQMITTFYTYQDTKSSTRVAQVAHLAPPTEEHSVRKRILGRYLLDIHIRRYSVTSFPRSLYTTLTYQTDILAVQFYQQIFYHSLHATTCLQTRYYRLRSPRHGQFIPEEDVYAKPIITVKEHLELRRRVEYQSTFFLSLTIEASL